MRNDKRRDQNSEVICARDKVEGPEACKRRAIVLMKCGRSVGERKMSGVPLFEKIRSINLGSAQRAVADLKIIKFKKRKYILALHSCRPKTDQRKEEALINNLSQLIRYRLLSTLFNFNP